MVAILTSAGCPDAGDHILMSAFHHFIQATDVSGAGQTSHESMDGGYHRGVTLEKHQCVCVRVYVIKC